MCIYVYLCIYVCMYDVRRDIQIPCTRYVAINRLYLLSLSLRFSRVGSPSVRSFVTISKVLTKLHRT